MGWFCTAGFGVGWCSWVWGNHGDGAPPLAAKVGPLVGPNSVGFGPISAQPGAKRTLWDSQARWTIKLAKTGEEKAYRELLHGPPELAGHNSFGPLSLPIWALQTHFRAHLIPLNMLPTLGSLVWADMSMETLPLVAGHVDFPCPWQCVQNGRIFITAKVQHLHQLSPWHPCAVQGECRAPGQVFGAQPSVEKFTKRGPPWPKHDGI